MAIKFRVKFRGEDLGVMNSDEVTMNQAIQLEDKTGMTLDDLVKGLGRSQGRAVQAVVWFQAFRSGRTFDLHQDFTFGDFDVEPVEDPLPVEVASPKGRGGKVTALPTAATGT